MKNYIKNKTALVTGASSGIGRQLAYDLAEHGVDLVLVSRNLDKLYDSKEKILNDFPVKIDVFQMDVRNHNEVSNIINDILKNTTIDILINNAGLALGLEPVDQGNIDQWDTMIDTNIKGLLYVSRKVIPQMRSLPTAHIINLGSVAGKVAYPNGNVYCATKAAVHSLGEAMNADLFGTNVKVSTIAPGAVETNFSNIRFEGDQERAKSVYEGYTPLTAQDISDAIINILNTPPHVNIQYLDIMPTAQRNPYMLYKV